MPKDPAHGKVGWPSREVEDPCFFSCQVGTGQLVNPAGHVTAKPAWYGPRMPEPDEPDEPDETPEPPLGELTIQQLLALSPKEADAVMADASKGMMAPVLRFGVQVHEAVERLDPSLAQQYRRRVSALADDLAHLLGVSSMDLGELDDQRRGVVLSSFLAFSEDDDDDDEEEAPVAPKTPGDLAPA